MENLTQPKPMSMKGDVGANWNKFKKNFQLYIAATGYKDKPQEVKAAVLLHCMGEQAREISEKMDLEKAELNNCDIMLQKFDDYFSPKTNVTVETHKFNTRCQNVGETFEIFLTDLRRIAANCDFGNMEDRLITDRIVRGIRKKKTKDTLLSEPNLDLTKAISICKAAEQYENDEKTLEVNEIKKKHNYRQPTNQQMYKKNYTGSGAYKRTDPNNRSEEKRSGREEKQESSTGRQQNPCNRCGITHEYNNCPAYGKQCTNCKKNNHYAKFCKSQEKVSSFDQAVSQDEAREKQQQQKPCIRCGTTHRYNNCPAYGKQCTKCKKNDHYAKFCKTQEKVYSLDQAVSQDEAREKQQQQKPCIRCGTTHQYNNCPAYGKQCTKCKKNNHYAKCCKTRAKVHSLDQEVSEDEEDDYVLGPGRMNAEVQERLDRSIALQLSLEMSEGTENNQMMRMGGTVPGPQGMVQQPLPNIATDRPGSINAELQERLDLMMAIDLSTGRSEGTENNQMMKNNEECRGQCSACSDAPSCMVCTPCYHMALCGQCADQMRDNSKDFAGGTNPLFGRLRCPLCNENVSEFKRVYTA